MSYPVRMTMAELVDVFEAFGAQGLASCDSVAQVGFLNGHAVCCVWCNSSHSS